MEALSAHSREFARACLSRVVFICLAIVFFVVSSATNLKGQASGITPKADTQSPSPTTPISLKELVREAEQNNPEIAAAQRGYAASTHLARQASALPETQIKAQLFSVGSPKPFAGYTNSDFAYIGLGVSQEIPYPGKRDLRAQVANREADVRRVQIDSVRRSITDKIKGAYLRLAYLQ